MCAIDVAVTLSHCASRSRACASRSRATSCALRDATGAIRSRLTWHAEREVRVTVRVPLRVLWAAPGRVAGKGCVAEGMNEPGWLRHIAILRSCMAPVAVRKTRPPHVGTYALHQIALQIACTCVDACVCVCLRVFACLRGHRRRRISRRNRPCPP